MFPYPSRLLQRQYQYLPARLVLAGTLILMGLVAAACISTTSAQAALLSTGTCSEATLTQPFARWGDTNLYELVPQGDFESAPTQWTLSAGASRASGSDSTDATGVAGSYSLALPAGSSAQSPYLCVNASYPTFRLFARSSVLLSTIAVAVVYKTPLGVIALPLGAIAPGGSWQPTQPMLTGSVVAGLLTGGTAQAALRFTALTGSSQIDDVYIDPRMR